MPNKIIKGGSIQLYALIALLLLSLGFGLGMRVGIKYEAGKTADAVVAQAKTDVAVAEKQTAVVVEEGSWMQPFYEYKLDRDTFFVRADQEITRHYEAKAAAAPKPRPLKSVTADIPSTTKNLPHEINPPADCDAGDDAGDLFDADELRLFNLGNKKADFAPHPGTVHGEVPREPAGREGR